jgi:hypothetical protein
MIHLKIHIVTGHHYQKMKTKNIFTLVDIFIVNYITISFIKLNLLKPQPRHAQINIILVCLCLETSSWDYISKLKNSSFVAYKF